MVTFLFERELRLTCDWLQTRVYIVNLLMVERYSRNPVLGVLRPSMINSFMSSQANEECGSNANGNRPPHTEQGWGLAILAVQKTRLNYILN